MKVLLAFVFVVFGDFSAHASADKAEAWRIVPNNQVCMVTNVYFERKQIPVETSGKTYYGCCENCKKTLAEDPASRTAVDPVSKKPVDKAGAVIAANDDGEVLYFENKKSFETYAKSSKKK